MSGRAEPESDIDAVIAWVDGADPDHAAKRARFQAKGSHHDEGTTATRFVQNGELRFAVASLARYAPFLRRIHVVTDAQDPLPLLGPVLERYSFLRERIATVDHRDIFRGYEHLLPTFNSISIETMLHRIPGLAPRYVYFNDDFFLGRPVRPEDWFAARGPVLRGAWKPFYEDRWSYRFKTLLDWRGARQLRPGFITSQQRAARMVWSGQRYFQVGHVPHPVQRETIARVFASNEERMIRQAAHRFRHPSQVSVVGLANHAELEAGHADVRADGAVGYLKPSNASPDTVRDLLADLERNRFMAGCAQSVDEWSGAARAALLDGLERHFLGLQ